MSAAARYPRHSIHTPPAFAPPSSLFALLCARRLFCCCLLCAALCPSPERGVRRPRLCDMALHSGSGDITPSLSIRFYCPYAARPSYNTVDTMIYGAMPPRCITITLSLYPRTTTTAPRHNAPLSTIIHSDHAARHSSHSTPHLRSSSSHRPTPQSSLCAPRIDTPSLLRSYHRTTTSHLLLLCATHSSFLHSLRGPLLATPTASS